MYRLNVRDRAAERHTGQKVLLFTIAFMLGCSLALVFVYQQIQMMGMNQ